VAPISAHAVRWSRRLPCLSAVALVASLGAGIESADARPNRSYGAHSGQRPQPRSTRQYEKKDKEKPAQLQPVHLIVISIPKQRISVYGGGGFHMQGVVSTGMSGFPTPIGVFSIIQKNRYHRSNIYSGAPMPYMQRITWSGVAMHEGVVPGHPASHGCIRLTHKFASELWGMTRMGVRVVVTPDDAQPVELAHPNLPVPNMTSVPASPTEAEQAKPSLVALSGDKAADASAPQAAVKLLSPLDRAKSARTQMVAEAPAKTRAAKEAAEVAATKATEANRAMAALREAEAALAAAREKLAAAVKAAGQATSPEATEKAKSDQSAAEARVEEATKVATDAAAIESAKTQDALAAATAAWDAEKGSDLAAATIRAGERAIEPISVFVSKKAGRIYVRQAWRAIHEAPVSFKDPETSLGTHVYVAVETLEDGKGMRWLSVTYPQSTSGPDSKPPPRARRGDRPEPVAAVESGRPRETAAGALARIELSNETKAFIADRLWAGASLIVSDYPLSNEAGKYTDVIVQPR
jgi:L,D-transpeptidase catalytic domain